MKCYPLLIPFILTALGGAVHAQLTPVLVEAESGMLGDDWSTGTDSGLEYITITSNSTGLSPGTKERVATLTVDIPSPGIWELYVHIRVGSGATSDDSLLYGDGFGLMSPSSSADWIRVDGLYLAGYESTDTDLVLGGDDRGTAGTEVWKWVKLAGTSLGEAPAVFDVAEAGPYTFELGGREDGLWIDKIAFGKEGVWFTAAELDAGLPGDTEGPPPPFEPTGPPLALGQSKWLGCIYSPAQIINHDKYFNQLTPENSGKWGSVEGARDNMNWGPLDNAYNYAKEHGEPFRFHVLVWGNQQPAWIESLSPAEQLEEIEEWFAAVAARYPDIDYVEVVNEPLHAAPVYATALGGGGTTGFDWIIKSFEMARQYFPDSALVLNEYSVVNDYGMMSSYLYIVNLLKDRGLIDIVAEQAHGFSTGGSVQNMKDQLDRLAATGLPIMITEFDVSGATDEIQLLAYQRIFPVFWEHPAVMGITLWGYRPGTWRDNAELVRYDDTERPAMEWLREYIVSTTESWMGYPVRYNWVETGSWLSKVYIGNSPWIWFKKMGWVWADEDTATEAGTWMYFPRQPAQ